jgi:hypothetical protein
VHGTPGEQLPGEIMTDSVQFALKARAFIVKPAVQGAFVHAELSGDVIDRAVSGQQRRAQQSARITGDVCLSLHVKFFRFLLQMPMQQGVCTLNLVIQPATRKHNGISVRVESQGRPIELPVGCRVRRRPA